MYFPGTLWTRLFLATAVIQGLLALLLEAYVFVTFENDLDPLAVGVPKGHTVPMYFSLFIFAFVYEIIVVYDALRLSSMIQVVGLCIYNVLLLAYAAYQPTNVKEALDSLTNAQAWDLNAMRSLLPPELHTWDRIAPALLGLILLQVVATLVLGFLAYKLHFEFAWVVYKVIHADLSMKNRLLMFHIYMALVKFDFFFLLGFLVQIVTLLGSNKTDPEFGLSIGAIAIALFVMWLAIECALRENKPGTIAILLAYLGAALYLGYKLSVLFRQSNYLLIIFGALTLAMMLATIVMAIVCMSNFDKGLLAYTMPQQKLPEENIHLRYTQNYAYPPQSPRMDLD